MFAACLPLPKRFATAAARSASSIMVGNHHNDNAVLSAQGFVNHKIRRATMPATQPRDLQGQKALVTGATSGIGRAVALQLGRDGAEVIVHGRDVARGAETVESITAAGGRARFVGADLSDPADLQRLVRASSRMWPSVSRSRLS